MSADGAGSTADVGEEPGWVGDVLRFWFHEINADEWFATDHHLDERMRERFLSLHERLVAQQPRDAATPRELLATIVVLDQFSRNLYRGSPRAYAADALARRLARAAVNRGCDLSMSAAERMFVYLPFEHSEDRDDQALSVRLFEQLGDDNWTRYALAHKAIIDDFGRFPHRNEVLGRESTPEELERLKQPMSSF
jgi:uncharacterized protein (DUF924 family)